MGVATWPGVSGNTTYVVKKMERFADDAERESAPDSILISTNTYNICMEHDTTR